MRPSPTCQWVTHLGEGVGAVFCGAPSSRGSYCAEHGSIVHRDSPFKIPDYHGTMPAHGRPLKAIHAARIVQDALWVSARLEEHLNDGGRCDRLNESDPRDLDFGE